MFRITKSIWRTLVGATALMCCLTSCKKDAGNDDGGDPNAPVVISSYAPEKPMWGQEVIINGSGFSSNLSEVEVYFPGNNAYINPGYLEMMRVITAEVIEASPTRLKVKMPYITSLSSFGNIMIPSSLHNGYGKIAVKIGDKPLYTFPVQESEYIYFRAAPFINGAGIEPYGYGGVYVKPGRKVRFSGKGFGLTTTEGTLTINGRQAVIDSVWYNVVVSGEGCWNMIATFPAEAGSKVSGNVDHTYTYTRFGASVTRTVPGIALPDLVVTGNTLLGNYTTGMSVTDFTITGRSLYANQIRISNGASVVATVPITGASVSATSVSSFIPLSILLPLGAATYSVVLYDSDLNQGFGTLGSITISP
ncbi:MAG TPA: hypothetical protein PKY29_01885 [Ferruginibacter sp.]|nr:hypothetical protein [Ferruginibacter sp.]HRO18360.1 hypothetical protein [Ferruginibacter sp.]HRQ20030.1 hypothetical protein [Ferruginibacter sp.]